MTLLLILVLAQAQRNALAQVEKQMSEAPFEAFTIARKALDGITSTPEQVQQLFAHGARLHESRLRQLSASQVEELANVQAKTLNDKPAAERTRRSWLDYRLESIGPADGPGRVQLARLHLDWFEDHKTAAALCIEAVRLAPEDLQAKRMLTKELGYEETDRGWQPKTQLNEANLRAKLAQVRNGLSQDEVRAILGFPARRAQQIGFRRYREQWWYDSPVAIRIEFDCIKGQTPSVILFNAQAPKP